MSELLENNTQPFLPPRMLLSHLEWCFISFPRIPCHSLLMLFSHPLQGGAQIILAEVCRSGERSTRWYNLLSYKYLKKQSREPKPAGAMAPIPGPESTVSWTTALHPSPIKGSTWSAGRKSLSQSWRWLDIRGGWVCVCVCVTQSLTVRLCATPWTVACQAPLSMGFSRKNTEVGCHSLLQGNIPNSGPEPGSPALQADFCTLWASREAWTSEVE